MTYTEATSWLFEQFPAYQKVGVSAYKPDMDNMHALCALFEIDHSQLKFIHVAGTNGKGSTCNLLASVLQENNYRTGLFTSPHILDFSERIRVNGQVIAEVEVINFCALIQQTDFDIKPSFFEITWLLALKHFIQQQCDICVVEVGLGGRLDATNIISPLLTIITNIGLDHTAILGPTLNHIAKEKAGIIKAYVPLVLSEKQADLYSVFEDKCTALDAPLYLAEAAKHLNCIHPKGTYLFRNERCVRKAIEVLELQGYSCSPEAIDRGVQNVQANTGFRGRFETLSLKPRILIDAAHNKEGLKALLDEVVQLEHQRLFIIYGASNDKDVKQLLPLFPSQAELLLTCFSNQRSVSFTELQQIRQQSDRKIEIFTDCEIAWKHAQQLANESDIVLITGSFFLLSDFFSFFSKNDLHGKLN